MKTAVYGIQSVTLTDPGANGAFPATWTGGNAFSFKAIVKDSLSFNDSAASDNDIEVEDSDDVYASLQSGIDTKGFTMDTYDLSEEAYIKLQQFTKPTTGNEDGWVYAPVSSTDLIQAVQIITKQFDDFPSKTFQWAKMKLNVTRAGTIGKSGFPNFHIEFRELMNADGTGQPISGHRWKINAQAQSQG